MEQSTGKMQLEEIKQQVLAMYEKFKLIHVTVNHKRTHIIDAPSKIIGIYDRFLCVESTVNHYVEKFTINYIDLMTNNIVIKELEKSLN